MFGEALGAVTALKQETLALGDLGELALELPGLACKNQRRITGKLLLDIRELREIVVNGQLHDRKIAPRARCPGLSHSLYSTWSPPILIEVRMGKGSKHQIWSASLSPKSSNIGGKRSCFRPLPPEVRGLYTA